jgi:hypothetical protein
VIETMGPQSPSCLEEKLQDGEPFWSFFIEKLLLNATYFFGNMTIIAGEIATNNDVEWLLTFIFREIEDSTNFVETESFV